MDVWISEIGLTYHIKITKYPLILQHVAYSFTVTFCNSVDISYWQYLQFSLDAMCMMLFNYRSPCLEIFGKIFGVPWCTDFWFSALWIQLWVSWPPFVYFLLNMCLLHCLLCVFVCLAYRIADQRFCTIFFVHSVAY